MMIEVQFYNFLKHGKGTSHYHPSD